MTDSTAKLKATLKEVLPEGIKRPLISLYRAVRERTSAGNLNVLAELYGSDKWGSHFYTQYYMPLFTPMRHERIKLLEIGIGGYDDAYKGGESLKMWHTFFTKAKIYGIDIYDKHGLENNRVKTFKGSQSDEEFLGKVVSETGELDIIIDDGSHRPSDQIITFNFLFEYLKKGGYYVVEDTTTSYFKSWGGDENIHSPGTFLNYAKRLTDNVNYFHLKKSDSYKDTGDMLKKEFEYICFYKDLVIIKKAF